jgi:hypothetical protein
MAPSRKSRREKEKPETPMAWKLPMDLLREIIARSDHRTLVRCAATCNLLRREILSPPFDRRVTEAAPCILVNLCADAKKPLALVHPTTPAAMTFCHKHLPRLLSRNVGILLANYKPVSSRRGLLGLRRLNIEKRPKSDRCSELCVYDPLSGAQTFFSDPPEIRINQYYDPKYVVLTAADGIDCSFLLLVLDLHGYGIRVHTASPCGTWGPVRYESKHDTVWMSPRKRGDPAILSHGAIHWVSSDYHKQIRSYDLRTRKQGSVKLPPSNCDVKHDGNQLYLATSSDGKLLKLLTIQGFMLYVWLQVPAGSDWSLETVIDIEEKLRSLDPPVTGGPDKRIEFQGSGRRTGEVVFLVEVRKQGYTDVYSDTLIVFDLEAMKMHRQKRGLVLLEIDLPSRLKNMKTFS